MDFSISTGATKGTQSPISGKGILNVEITENTGGALNSITVTVDMARHTVASLSKNNTLSVTVGGRSYVNYKYDELAVDEMGGTLAFTSYEEEEQQGSEYRTRVFIGVTLQVIIDTLSNGYTVDTEGLEVGKTIEAEYQRNESDYTMLSRLVGSDRLSKKNDDKGGGSTITADTMTACSGNINARQSFKSAKTLWFNPNTGDYGEETAGHGKPVFMVQGIFDTQTEAQNEAKTALSGVTKYESTCTVTCDINTGISAGGTCTLIGVSAHLAKTWQVKSVTHAFNDKGGTTTANLYYLT